jgi:hypothetical protein
VKTLLRIACWVLVAAAIVWWRPGPARFEQRWVAMPEAMSWATINKARKAAAQPSFCMPHKCRVG